jgi:hypothetical protein
VWRRFVGSWRNARPPPRAASATSKFELKESPWRRGGSTCFPHSTRTPAGAGACRPTPRRDIRTQLFRFYRALPLELETEGRAPAACVTSCSVGFHQRDFKVRDAKSQACFISLPPPQPRLVLQKTQVAAPAPPSPAPQNTLRAQKRLRHHPAEVLVCLERGAIGPYLPRSIANTPVARARWVTARPRRPPRGGLGLSRSKISAPWGVQSRAQSLAVLIRHTPTPTHTRAPI